MRARPWGFARGEIFIVIRKRQTAAFKWRTVKEPPSKQSRSYRRKTPKIALNPYSGVRFWAFLRFGSKSAIRQQKGGASYAPYAELSQERMGVWKRTPIRERKAHAGGDCKGSDCRRSNGFAESGYCLIDFTRNYVLW